MGLFGEQQSHGSSLLGTMQRWNVGIWTVIRLTLECWGFSRFNSLVKAAIGLYHLLVKKCLCFGLDGIVRDFVVGEQKGQFESTRIRQRDELGLTLLLFKSLGGGDFAASI